MKRLNLYFAAAMLFLAFSYHEVTKLEAAVSQEQPVSVVLRLNVNGGTVLFRVVGHIIQEPPDNEMQHTILISQ
jgi:hypothetical protein